MSHFPKGKFQMEIQQLVTHVPSPALPGSGLVGMISARCIKAPLMIGSKVMLECFRFPTYRSIKNFQFGLALITSNQKRMKNWQHQGENMNLLMRTTKGTKENKRASPIILLISFSPFVVEKTSLGLKADKKSQGTSPWL